jgi:chloramphenicol-sensitive protein RarD
MKKTLDSPPVKQSLDGAMYAVLAYSAWGLLPIYWKLFGQFSAIAVVSHRILWSMIFLLSLLLLQKRRAEFSQLWHSPSYLVSLLMTAGMLAFNWGLYIYGVNTDRVVEASLGYYINPLVNVLLGCVFLKERLRWVQGLAVLLATLGVANLVWYLGQVPWIALGLALSFGFYGLLRKTIPVTPLVGLAMETTLIAPIAVIVLLAQSLNGVSVWGTNATMTLLLMSSGILTSMPLLWFNNAAKRLHLSTLGFFQYIAPSLGLILGVLVYHEPFTHTHLVTFSLIWLAILTYSVASFSGQSRG